MKKYDANFIAPTNMQADRFTKQCTKIIGERGMRPIIVNDGKSINGKMIDNR